jgi:hypothetical protein
MSDPGTPDQGDGGLMTECPERSPRDGAGCNVVATAMCTYDTQECTCDQAQGGGFGGGFGGGGGDETVWNCDQLGGDPAGPSDAGATPSCPVAAPEEGGDCDLPRETACEYGAQSCSCGGPPNNRNWGCEGGETPPANEDASVPGPLEPTPFGDDGGSSTDAG